MKESNESLLYTTYTSSSYEMLLISWDATNLPGKNAVTGNVYKFIL